MDVGLAVPSGTAYDIQNKKMFEPKRCTAYKQQTKKLEIHYIANKMKIC